MLTFSLFPSGEFRQTRKVRLLQMWKLRYIDGHTKADSWKLRIFDPYSFWVVYP